MATIDQLGPPKENVPRVFKRNAPPFNFFRLKPYLGRNASALELNLAAGTFTVDGLKGKETYKILGWLYPSSGDLNKSYMEIQTLKERVAIPVAVLNKLFNTSIPLPVGTKAPWTKGRK